MTRRMGDSVTDPSLALDEEGHLWLDSERSIAVFPPEDELSPATIVFQNDPFAIAVITLEGGVELDDLIQALQFLREAP